MSVPQITSFLDSAIRSRISIRLIAEHHITLSTALSEALDLNRYVGIVDPHCSPHHMIKMCASFVSQLCDATLGVSPQVVCDGDVNATFPCVPYLLSTSHLFYLSSYVTVHLEYILTELLKNAFRATVEHHHTIHGSNTTKQLPPVNITLSPPVSLSPTNEHYFCIRIRDQGGGVSPANRARIFSYAFTTAGCGAEIDDQPGPYAAQHIGGIAAIGDTGNADTGLFAEISGKGLQTGLGTIAGLGYGLPMSRLYAK